MRRALPVSFPLRKGDSGKDALSAHLYHALLSRVWPSANQDHYQPSTAAATPRSRAPLGRPGGLFLERLSHLPRSRHRRPDVTRRPALLRSPATPTRGSLAVRSPPSRLRQGTQGALRAPSRRYPASPAKLSPLGEASDELVRTVRISQGPPSRMPYDCRWTALPFSPSPTLQQGTPSQPTQVSSYLRQRYGTCRHLLARLDAFNGTCRHSYHHALRADCSTRRLA